MEDAYDILGVPPGSSDREVTRAYRTLARTCHPDKRPNDSEATGEFQKLSEAYQSIINERAYSEGGITVGCSLFDPGKVFWSFVSFVDHTVKSTYYR